MSKVDLADLLARHPGATVSKPVDVDELIRRADTLHAVSHAPLPLAGESVIAAAQRSIPGGPYASETERQFAAWLEKQPDLNGWEWQYRGDGYPLDLPAGFKYKPDWHCADTGPDNWKFERILVEVKWRNKGSSIGRTAEQRSRIMLKLSAWKWPDLDFYFVRPKGESFVEWAWSFAEVQPDGSVSFRRNVSPWTPRPLKAIRKKSTA